MEWIQWCGEYYFLTLQIAWLKRCRKKTLNLNRIHNLISHKEIIDTKKWMMFHAKIIHWLNVPIRWEWYLRVSFLGFTAIIQWATPKLGVWEVIIFRPKNKYIFNLFIHEWLYGVDNISEFSTKTRENC